MLSGRDTSSGEEIQARSIFSDIFDMGVTILGQLRRDISPDQLLAARDSAQDLIKSISSRDSSSNDIVKLLNTLGSSRRDIDLSDLAVRDDWEDFVKMLNTRELDFKRDMQARGLFSSILDWGRDALSDVAVHLRDLTPDEFAGRNTVDDFINKRTSNHATREPNPEQGIHARDPVNSPEARDSQAANDFIKALLNSRESSTDSIDLMNLAALASRALDELD
jgi:hypothetical protein